MIAMENRTNRGKQLTVAIAAFALVLCICVVALPSEEVSAAGNTYEVAAEPSESQYADIPSAIAAAEEASETTFTIKLMSDVTGKGFITDAGQNVTIDLNGFTYTINYCVGSTGTETNGMQLLANSVVTIKNGTITSTADAMAWDKSTSNYEAIGAGILIQNYSNLTLDNVFVDGKNLATDVYSGSAYALSNNNSNTVLKGETNIDAPEGHVAFDVCNFSSYTTDAVVTFDSDYTGTINGDVEMTYVNNANDVGINLIIEEGASVDINGSIDSTQTKSVIDVKGTLAADDITNSGTLNVYGTLRADVTNQGDSAKFNYTPDATINGKVDGETVNTQWQPLPLTDGVVIDASSSIVASSNQRVTVDGNVKVVAGGSITINGQLVINEGGTLTLEKGAEVIVEGQGTVIVNGDLIIEAGASDSQTFKFNGYEMTVNGYVALNGADSFISTGKVTVNGTFEINDEASATLDNATVAEGGEILIYGKATTTSGIITNNGTITVDSEDVGGFSVVMGDNSVLDVINGYGTITVSDADGNGLVLGNVAGAYITDSVVTDENDDEISTLYLSGTVIYAVNADSTNASGNIQVTGDKVEIAEATTLGENVVLDVKGGVTVSAEMTVTADGAKIIGDSTGSITVTGKIVTKADIDAAVDSNTKDLPVNASMYRETGTSYYVYTTLATALGDGATSITAFGKNTVDTDITIPVGTTVTMDSTATITVTEDATMTVAADERNSGRFDTNAAANDSVIVDGTLVLENANKSRASSEKILSDTFKDVGDSTTYTNIYNAVENAADGETVEVSRGTAEGITLDKDLTIGTGVTLLIPSGETVTVGNGVTVTVDGTLQSEGTYTISPAVADDKNTPANEAKAAGATIVNGMFLYDTGDYKDMIVGAYFGYDGTNAIAPLASVPSIINDIEGNTITLYGEMEVGDIDLSAYEGRNLTLKAQNDLTFSSITVGAVKFESSEYLVNEKNVTSVNGAIVLTNGEVVLENVYGITAQNTTGSDDTVTSSVGGNVLACDDPSTEKVLETGKVTFEGTISSGASFGAKTSVNGLVSAVVSNGATLTVTAGTIADISVDGAMTIGASGVQIGDIAVAGSVSIAADVEDATVTGNMFIGVSVETVKEKKIITDLGVQASVDGLTLSGNTAVAYVSPSASVGDSFESLAVTEYYLDQETLYVTAYAAASNTVEIDTIGITVENAVFNGWVDENNTPVSGAIGSPSKVYADIVRDIYEVEVTADGGIGTVSIDGVVLKKDNNVFTLGNGEKLSAGSYTIGYIANSGFTTDNVKITVNGEEISGNTITLSGTPAAGETSIKVSISIYGTEPSSSGSGEIIVNVPKDDGMSLTDILLIVLVILIVIMAIIVALRMMRS